MTEDRRQSDRRVTWQPETPEEFAQRVYGQLQTLEPSLSRALREHIAQAVRAVPTDETTRLESAAWLAYEAWRDTHR